MSIKYIFLIVLVCATLSGTWAFGTPITSLLAPFLKAPQFANNGTCVGCTIVISLLEQLAIRDNVSIERWLEKGCNLFPGQFATTCKYYATTYGPMILKLFALGFTADEVCHGIDFCTPETKCRLWPKSGLDTTQLEVIQLETRRHLDRLSASKLQSNNGDKKNPKTPVGAWEWPWQWLYDIIAKAINDHKPIVDLDGDLFSMPKTLRGSDWRGKDCNDFDGKMYPGRKATTYPPNVDHNCNGIFAINGTDYEKLFCDNSSAIGIVGFGDSATAHFSIPPDYLNASAIDQNTYNDILSVITNEIDWPQRSATTGYEDSKPGVPISSLYKYLVARNPCNHRDFQNIAVNGMRSGAALKLTSTIARNQKLDKPVIVKYALIGNDVCTPHHSFSVMTKPQQFLENTVANLQALDEILPAGSHVLMIGLAQGSVLWDWLHDRIHPIGVTYADMYAFLNCFKINPCWGWMNSDPDVRKFTDERAANLSAIYPQIVANYTFKNFDLEYYDFPLKELAAMWAKKGGENWQLIEPIDGFHPNQIAHALEADFLWGKLNKDHPDWLGPVNPYASQILKLFGNQGGY